MHMNEHSDGRSDGQSKPSDIPDNIILCGFMGTGKSTVGKIVAERLGWMFVDTDELIEKMAGRPIRQIFSEFGETWFRDLESDLCQSLADFDHLIIATGGGIVLRPENRERLLRAGLVICLTASAQEIASRLVHVTNRPLLAVKNPVDQITQLLTDRTSV